MTSLSRRTGLSTGAPDPLGDQSAPIRIETVIPMFTIEELETGLRLLATADFDRSAFWDANIDSFRQTVLFAIRETSDALLSPRITSAWRGQLESQLEALVQFIELADRYLKHRSGDIVRSRLN